MLAANVERTLERCTLKQESEIILKAAIECKVIIAYVNSGLAQLHIAGAEAECRTFNIHVGHTLHLQFHIAEVDTTRSLHLVKLLLLDVRQTASQTHISINHTIEIHILQRIYILNLTQVELTLCRSLEIGVADGRLHICGHTERIASKREIKGVNHNRCCIQATTRILNHSGNIDTINTCGE